MDVPPVPGVASTPLPPTPATDAGPSGLQFDKAEFGATGATACAGCRQPIAGEYFDVNGQPFCPTCKAQVEAVLGGRPGPSGFFRAVAGGVAGGVAGALIYYLVLATSGYEIGIIAIAVGWLVGKGVQWGTRGRGGAVYQALAIVITYVAIVSTYVPGVIEGLRKVESARTAPTTATGTPAPGPATAAPAQAPSVAGFLIGLAVFVVLVLALPFLAGFQNILGLVIIAIGLYEAWKINRRVPLAISGPFHAAFRPTGAAAPGA
jgi:hypothetical protein